MNKNLHYLYFNKWNTIKVGDSFTKLIIQLYSLSLYNVKLAVIFLLFLKNSTSVNAQYNYIAEVSEIQKDAGICDADWGGTDDPIFEFDCYEYSGVTSLINYDPNVWIGKTFESTSNPRSNDMNCNGYVVGNGQNRSGDILKFFLKGSDEDYCCGWYCNHNSNSCVSSWTSTDYTYRNDPKNQWNQFQLNWSGSYRGKVKVRWGNYYASPQTAYGNGEWVGAFYDNTDFTSYMGYMTENETFDTDFPNINDNDGAQDYRLFGGNALPNSNTVYTESFSARYRMTKNFTSCGFYSFTVGADDGYRLKIDGSTVIDNWTDGGYRTNTIVAYISSGNHNLEIEYYEGSGGNRLSFSYSQVATSPSATVATTNPSTCGGNGNITVTPTSTNAASLWYASNCSSSTPQFGTQNTYGNNISYTGGYLQLTQNANSKDGTLVMNNATGYNASSILLDFDLYIGDGGGADGFSITYAGDIPGTPAGNELGLSSSNGLEIRFRTYTGGTCPQAVSVWYNETQVGSCGLASSNWRTASWQHVQLYINNSNQLTLKIGSNTAYTNLALPAGYGSQNKSTWKVALSARTGGANDNHRVDNITLLAFNQYEYSADGSGWQSSNSFTKTAGTYPMYIRAIGNYCSVSLGNATLTDPAKPTITLGTNPTICYSTSNQNANLPFTATTNSPNQYWIDFASGITDVGSSVSPSSLPVSPIGIPVAGSTASSTYNATIFVKNSTTSCVSTGNAVTVTVRPQLLPSASHTIASCADSDNPYAQLTATAPGAGISGIWTKPNIAHAGTISNASNSSTIITGLSTSGATTDVQWSLYYNSAPACTTALSTALSITPTSLANITQVSIQNDGAATSTGTPVQTRYACRTCSVKNGNTYTFYDASGKIIATILDKTSNGADLGSTEVCIGYDYNPPTVTSANVKTITDNFGRTQPYLPRSWTIKPAAGSDATVTLYFTAAELSALATRASTTLYNFSSLDLAVTKYPGGTGNGQFIAPKTTGGVFTPSTFGNYYSDYQVTFDVNSFSTFYIHPQMYPFAALPVELVSFTGYNDELRNILNWTTASEINADRFEIQKLSDTNNDWQFIGEVVAAGNSQGQKDYTFIDAAPFVGNNYYRLKMIDNDGTFTYSNTINIPISEAIVNSFINIFPNPTTGNVKVLLQSIKEKASELSITNLLGQQVLTIPATLQKGINTVTFDISNLASGTYLISFIDETGIKHTTKLIKE